MESDPTLPSTEDVIRKTEQITKNIQELLRAAQENKHDRSESEERRIFNSLGSVLFFCFRFLASTSSYVHHDSVIYSYFYLISVPLYVCYFHSYCSLPLPFCSAVIMFFWCHCAPVPPPWEQTMWAWRRAAAQAQPGMFQHSGALGREGPAPPSAAQPPVPWPHLLVLWPLSLPPRHSFIFLSLTQFLPRLFSSFSPANKLSLFLSNVLLTVLTCLHFCTDWICLSFLGMITLTSMQWFALEIYAGDCVWCNKFFSLILSLQCARDF